MAAFTSKAAGNSSAGGQTTWNEVGVPGVGDTAVANHAIAIDANWTLSGLTINANVTLNSGITFTPQGNVFHGNARFIMSAGSHIVFDAASATRKWFLGTASNQFNCKFIANGTVGSRCTVTKTGANFAYFDGGGEGSASGFGNNGGWETSYTDFEDICDSSGSLGTGMDDFGVHDRFLLFCTFDGCGPFFVARGANWNGSNNKSWRVEDCRWDNSPANAITGYVNLSFHNTGNGSGTIRCLRNAFCEGPNAELSVKLGVNTSGLVEDCYFDSNPFISNRAGINSVSGTPYDRCTIRISHKTQTATPFGGFPSPIYFLLDHVDPANRTLGIDGVGNPHVVAGFLPSVHDGHVLDYPHDTTLIDQGDGFWGSEDGTFRGSIIRNCLSIPSLSDDGSSSNIHPFIHQSNKTEVYHCTIVGRTSQLTYNERNMVTRTGTAQAGGAATITLDALASAVNNVYIDHRIFITNGTGAGQRRNITGYVGATKIATVTPAWTTPPDATSIFSVTEISVDQFKSNLISGGDLTGTNWGAGAYDTNSRTIVQVDTMTPEHIQYNFHHMAVPLDALTPGSARGYRLRLSSAPDGTNIYDDVTGPQFVDSTRNAARWAVVEKGQAYTEPTRPVRPVSYTDPAWVTWLTWKRAALDACRALLMDDPTAGYNELMPWVKEGFAPQNAALEDAGHDGVTIGAIAFAGTTPPPSSGQFVTVFAGVAR